MPPVLARPKNVVLAPRMGSATVEARDAMGDWMLTNLRTFFKGEQLSTPLV